jgi:hypothetical protein
MTAKKSFITSFVIERAELEIKTETDTAAVADIESLEDTTCLDTTDLDTTCLDTTDLDTTDLDTTDLDTYLKDDEPSYLKTAVTESGKEPRLHDFNLESVHTLDNPPEISDSNTMLAFEENGVSGSGESELGRRKVETGAGDVSDEKYEVRVFGVTLPLPGKEFAKVLTIILR